MLYSHFNPSKTAEYPPYSPPNTLGEDAAGVREGLANFARYTSTRRAEMLEELRRRETNPDVNVGEWNMWTGEKVKELKQKMDAATAQAKQPINTAKDVVSEMTAKVMGTSKDSLKEEVMDAADWWKTYGEKLVEDAKEVGSEKLADTQDFAYDAFYAWKQKAGDLKEVAQDKLHDIKGLGEMLEVGKEKVEEVIAATSEGLQGMSQDAWNVAHNTLEKVAEVGKDALEEVSNRVEGLKEGVRAQADSGRVEKLRLPRAQALHDSNNTLRNKVASLVERVKEGLVEDEEVRHEASVHAEWDNLDLQGKIGSIVNQLCMLGDDVIEGVMRKLEHERSQGTCFDQDAFSPMCPK